MTISPICDLLSFVSFRVRRPRRGGRGPCVSDRHGPAHKTPRRAQRQQPSIRVAFFLVLSRPFFLFLFRSRLIGRGLWRRAAAFSLHDQRTAPACLPSPVPACLTSTHTRSLAHSSSLRFTP